MLLSVASESAITVDLDATFLVALALFVALLLVLKPLLFDPMLKLFEERERRIDGARLQARKIDQKSAQALAKVEEGMAKARAEATVERERIRAEGVRGEQEILAVARIATARAIEAGKAASQAEGDSARAALKAEVAAMALDVAGRVLGRQVQP